MRTKVYAFKPKGKGYTQYVTKTYHGKNGGSSSSRSKKTSIMTDYVSGVIAKAIVHGVLGMKK